VRGCPNTRQLSKAHHLASSLQDSSSAGVNQQTCQVCRNRVSCYKGYGDNRTSTPGSSAKATTLPAA
jgi:hypothetical protein